MNGVDTAKALANGEFDQALEHAIEFGMAEGVKVERARIAAILRSVEAHVSEQQSVSRSTMAD